MDRQSPVHSGNVYRDIHAGDHAQVTVGNVYQQTEELTKEQKCCQTLKTSSYETYKDRNPPRVAQTCRWVLEHPQFLQWRSSQENAVLWITADPGCGKSVLSKALVDEHLYGNEPSTVCYFFFKDNEEQDKLAIALCALLHQLFSQQPNLLRHATPVWEKNGDKLQEESQEMWRILRASATDREARPIICIVDALDECNDKDRETLIRLLCELQIGALKNRSSGVLKVLVTSRPYDSVQRYFESAASQWPHIRLRGEEQNDRIHQEINLVIQQRVQDLRREFSLARDICGRLEEQLLQMKHRTYLWLHLTIEEVREMCRDSLYLDDMQIVSLPASVEEAYERILARIKDTQKNLARRILLIIVGARRPLSVQEMALALSAARARDQNSSTLSRIDPVRLERQIREQCGLFVFINHSQIFLIHQTAKEFLVAQSPSPRSNPTKWKSCLEALYTEDEMAVICVTYMHLAYFSYSHSAGQVKNGSATSNQSPTQYPPWEDSNSFWRYCAEYWTSHLRDDLLRRDEPLLRKCLSLFTTEDDLFARWFSIMWEAIDPYRSVPELDPQHVVAITGHVIALEKVLESRSDGVTLELTDRSTNRTALQWAATYGHKQVVQLLLDRGADINAQTEDGNALYAASAEGHEPVVRLLLERGADINAQGGDYGNALQAASAGGQEPVVRLLLERGADINAQGGFYGNTLQAASARGQEPVVRLLLNRGADINAQGGFYGNALQAASINGHEPIVRLLLERGADINTQGGFYGNALQAASREGHEPVVRLLLDRGADINAQGGLYGNALQAASAEGHKPVVRLLLERGAKKNSINTF